MSQSATTQSTPAPLATLLATGAVDGIPCTIDGQARTYVSPSTPVWARLVAPWTGHGEAVYVTADGWIGIRLAGEERVDEYAAERVTVRPHFGARV